MWLPVAPTSTCAIDEDGLNRDTANVVYLVRVVRREDIERERLDAVTIGCLNNDRVEGSWYY